MADSITDNTDLTAYEILTDYDIDQLTTVAMTDDDPDWETRHKRAWTKILDILAMKPRFIAEADLDDTSELTYASCYYVAYLATKAGRSERNKEQSKEFYGLFKKEMAETRLSLANGSTMASCSYGTIRGARA